MAAAAAQRTSFRETLMGMLPSEDVRSIYAGSGPVAERNKAIANGIPPYGDPVESGLAFTVREARNRLRDLISGARKIGSVGELVSYLRDNFMTPEIRSYGGATKGTMHLRDDVTGESAPAAAVHSTFSERGLKNLSGRERVSAPLPAAPTPVEVRYQDALRVAYKGQPMAFSGWEALKIGLPTALSRNTSLAYTVSDGVAYIGRPGEDARKPLECLGSGDKTREMLYSHYVSNQKNEADRLGIDAKDLARRANIEPDDVKADILRNQATLAEAKAAQAADVPSAKRFAKLSEGDQTRFLARHYVFDAQMTPRTPVLLRDKYLAEALKVSPELSASSLEKAFGQKFAQSWGGFHREQTAARQEERDNKVVDFQAIRAARNTRPEATLNAGTAFGGVAPTQAAPALKAGLVVVADETSRELRICRYSTDGNHKEVVQFNRLSDMPAGEYRLLVSGATYDRPSGYVVVAPDKSVTMQDAQRREHSVDGPSHSPAPGSVTSPQRWAVDGRSMSEGEWNAEVNPAPEPLPEPTALQTGPRFGYSAP